jgi:hypothetical protein
VVDVDEGTLRHGVLTTKLLLSYDLTLGMCLLSTLGAGKQVYLAFGYQSYKCLLAKKNMTEAEHLQTYG